MRDKLKRLVELDRERTLFTHIGAVLGWDQETYIPPRGIEERAEQLALIEGLAHEKAVHPEIGELLGALEAEQGLGDTEKAYLRVARREYDKETKLPSSLVIEMARQRSLSQAAWVQAKKQKNFARFAPHLRTMIDLNLEVAKALAAPGEGPYDVLLGLYELGGSEKAVARVFSALRKDLLRLLEKIKARPQVDDSFLRRKIPAQAQARMSQYFMDAIGFDKSRGRLDTAAHPFTTTLGRDDVRITTRYQEDFFPSSVFSTIHEGGHALYEMGIDPDAAFRGTRLAEAASMAIHESQSRMWENIVGRSPEFWKAHFAAVEAMAEGALDGVSREAFVKAVNKVERSLIRTEADEVSYGLHVIARFELESALINGRLDAADVPAAWNAKIKELLDLEVPDDAQGCLQDIHWSMGSFGYFPSYALGNLYAAQFWAKIQKDRPNLGAEIEAGDCAPLRGWLREQIHAPGARFSPGELVEKVTGEALDASYFTDYLERKYSRIYGF